MPSCVGFERGTGHCSAGSSCCLLSVGRPVTKGVLCSRFVHPVRGVCTASVQGCPVLYSPHSNNTREEIKYFSNLGVDESINDLMCSPAVVVHYFNCSHSQLLALEKTVVASI